MPITIPRYTVADLEHFPNNGTRYELLDGMLLVTASPRPVHQNVLSRLQNQLSTAVQAPGVAHVVGPGVVTVPPATHLQPDILVYPARFPIDLDWSDVNEHWLVVEVLSRSSRVYDREFKRDAYLALGVHEVWLVDTPDLSVEVSRVRGSHETVQDSFTWRVPGIELVVPIDLRAVFAGLG